MKATKQPPNSAGMSAYFQWLDARLVSEHQKHKARERSFTAFPARLTKPHSGPYVITPVDWSFLQ
jgi:hypothetical protein